MIIKIIGFGLAVISAACTAHWLYGLSVASMGLAAAMVTAASGLLLEAAKFYFASHRLGRGLRGLLTGVVTAGLMLASMGATYLYLEESLKRSTSSEVQVARLQSELNSLDRQIRQVEDNVATLSDMVHITKAQGFLKELGPVRERRAEVAAQLAREEKQAPPELLREYSWLIFGLVAVLVDVVGALCLMPVHQIAETQVVQEETPLDAEDVARARRMIADRGLKPTVTALRKVLHIQPEEAGRILRRLADDGVLVQQGRNNRYVVAEAV